MRYLTVEEIISLHVAIISRSGGILGIRDHGVLESAVAQPKMTFDGKDLYPATVDKAAALGHVIISNHPFLDGNKRTGQAAMEVFLVLNGCEIKAPVDEQEKLILKIATGSMSKDDLAEWLERRIVERLST
jgi:death-on-curing protein